MTPEQQRNVYVNAILASVKREKTWVPGINMREWLGINLDTAEFTGLLRPEIEKEMWRRKHERQA